MTLNYVSAALLWFFFYTERYKLHLLSIYFVNSIVWASKHSHARDLWFYRYRRNEWKTYLWERGPRVPVFCQNRKSLHPTTKRQRSSHETTATTGIWSHAKYSKSRGGHTYTYMYMVFGCNRHSTDLCLYSANVAIGFRTEISLRRWNKACHGKARNTAIENEKKSWTQTNLVSRERTFCS